MKFLLRAVGQTIIFDFLLTNLVQLNYLNANRSHLLFTFVEPRSDQDFHPPPFDFLTFGF